MGQQVRHAFCCNAAGAVDGYVEMSSQLRADLQYIIEGKGVLVQTDGNPLKAIDGAVAVTSLHFRSTLMCKLF